MADWSKATLLLPREGQWNELLSRSLSSSRVYNHLNPKETDQLLSYLFLNYFCTLWCKKKKRNRFDSELAQKAIGRNWYFKRGERRDLFRTSLNDYALPSRVARRQRNEGGPRTRRFPPIDGREFAYRCISMISSLAGKFRQLR